MKTYKILINAVALTTLVAFSAPLTLADDFVPAETAVTATAGITATGATSALNDNSNFATNINTGTSTGTVSIGGGASPVTVNSTTWDISAAGVASGFTGITSSGSINFTAGMSASGGTINLNDASNNAVNIATGTSTGAVTIGGTGTQTIAVGNGAGVKTVTIGSTNTTSATTIQSGSAGLILTGNPWSISAPGVASGLTGITSTGTINFSGATGGVRIHEAAANPATCTVGQLFYNTTRNQILKCSATNTWTIVSPRGVTFVDNTSVPGMADNKTTELWNDTTRPNITTSSATSQVQVSVIIEGTSGGTDNEYSTISIARTTNGTNPVCGTSPQVGPLMSGFTTDNNTPWTASGTFLDSPATIGDIRYTVCTNSASFGGPVNNAVNSSTISLVEMGN